MNVSRKAASLLRCLSGPDAAAILDVAERAAREGERRRLITTECTLPDSGMEVSVMIGRPVEDGITKRMPVLLGFTAKEGNAA